MAKILMRGKAPLPEITPADIHPGEVFTWGRGIHFYIKTDVHTKVNLGTGEVSDFLVMGGTYRLLRVVDAEICINEPV